MCRVNTVPYYPSTDAPVYSAAVSDFDGVVTLILWSCATAAAAADVVTHKSTVWWRRTVMTSSLQVEVAWDQEEQGEGCYRKKASGDVGQVYLLRPCTSVAYHCLPIISRFINSPADFAEYNKMVVYIPHVGVKSATGREGQSHLNFLTAVSRIQRQLCTPLLVTINFIISIFDV